MGKGRIIEGQRDPARLAAEKRQAAVVTLRGKQKGKKIGNLTPAEQRDLLLLLAMQLGLADEEGNLL